MDHYEQMAFDLEHGQEKRYGKYRGKLDDFWTETEARIFKEIKDLREKSSTYHPDNLR